MAEASDNLGSAGPARKVLTVSQLNREARLLLEGRFAQVWIEGEISNLARPASGHLYFTLKDAGAQVRCALFRNRNLVLGFRPRDGMHVLMRAQISLYEPRGDFQLLVEYMEEAGDGALRRAFDRLKQQLAAEGLFDTARKKAVPAYVRTIGVVTSPTGAAIRDILTVLRRRFPAIRVVIYPVPVQGSGAGAQIAAAIRRATQRSECDVLVIARGGGSLEDLWAFNEEVVARAIDDCPLPTVSAVGHEIDFTISDFVADQRAPTPSAAAEMLSPDGEQWRARVARWRQRLARAVDGRMRQRRESLLWLEKRLVHPGRRLEQIGQRLDELEQRLEHARRSQLRHKRAAIAELHARLRRHAPDQRIARLQDHRDDLARRMFSALKHQVDLKRARLGSLARALDAISPLATLARGYAIITRKPDGAIVRSSREVTTGERIVARLAEGGLLCRIEEVDPG